MLRRLVVAATGTLCALTVGLASVEPAKVRAQTVTQGPQGLGMPPRDQPPGERTVTIRTRFTPDGHEVVVQDAGTGIDEAALERLFTPFHTSKPKGMGMGLAICKTIIESPGPPRVSA